MVNLVTSTNKFGVKIDGHNTRVKFPHLRNRFRMEFIGFAAPIGGENLTMDARSCDFPKWSDEKKSIKTYNGEVKYAGAREYQDISFQVYLGIDNVNYRELLRQSSIQRNYANFAHATVPSNYKFITNVYHLGGEHEVLARWQCEGCWLQSVNIDGGEYGNYDGVSCNCTMSIDSALFFDENDELVTYEESLTTYLNNVLAV